MKIKFRFVYWLTAVLMFAASAGFAQSDSDFPAKPNPPRLVNDLAGVLSAQEREELEQVLLAYNDSTSSQIAIVTLKSVGQYDIADYAFKLGDRWGIGRKDRNNGVLILVAASDRKIWIATGYGLEGALPDGLIGRIIRNDITPFFKSGNYYQGLLNGVQSIVKAAVGEYKADPADQHGEEMPFLPALIFLIILIAIIMAASKGGGGGRGGRYISRRGTDIFMGGMLGGGFGGGLGRSGGGFGGGSSGGFGGFGGGSFGGGGAGGSW